MNHLPTLSIELRGLQETVSAHLSDRHDEINHHIAKTLEETLTEEWVMSRIKESIDATVMKAIEDLTTNHRLRYAISELVSDNITELLRNKDE